MQEELGNVFGVPGIAHVQGNPLRIADPEEREKVVQSFRLMAPAFQSRENRLEVMDVQGLEAAIMFPSGVGVSVEGEFLDDPAANVANVRAYNRWVQDDWGFAFKNRIFTPANVPLAKHRRHGRGARPHARRGRPDGDAAAGPAQRSVSRRSLLRPVLGVHPGVGRGGGRAPELHELPATAGAEYGYDPNTHYFDGFDAFQWFSYWGDRPIMETVAAMIFHNLFTRFPELARRYHRVRRGVGPVRRAQDGPRAS